MKEVFVYKCIYFHRDDEYPSAYRHVTQEVAVFKNREDALEYSKDFETNHYRCPSGAYTEYESIIVKETVL